MISGNMDHDVTATFESVLASYPWESIPGCAGRFVLRPSPSELNPQDLTNGSCQLHVYQLAGKDPVHIAILDDGGGILSYQHLDGTFVHTLNTPDGLKRKMMDLGIVFPQ